MQMLRCNQHNHKYDLCTDVRICWQVIIIIIIIVKALIIVDMMCNNHHTYMNVKAFSLFSPYDLILYAKLFFPVFRSDVSYELCSFILSSFFKREDIWCFYPFILLSFLTRELKNTSFRIQIIFHLYTLFSCFYDLDFFSLNWSNKVLAKLYWLIISQ